MKLVIITGLSGSGKSVALHTLEDSGFYCIDNLPAFLLETLAERLIKDPNPAHQLISVGIDARGEEESIEQLPALIARLQKQNIACEIIFLEAQAETLSKRFSETRRKHPLTDQRRTLADAMAYEQELLAPLRDAADLRIDTTRTNLHQLRELIRSRISDGQEKGTSILLQSFGFKHGLPPDADFVFDMRPLPNPHWRRDLRSLTGLDPKVAEFLQADPMPMQMRDDLIHFFDRWIPLFEKDGRNYLTIAIGCTGGQHRSVFMVEQLYQHLKDQGRRVVIRHRELS